MDWTNFIRSLGHDEATSMLDPAAYSRNEIEDDLIKLDMDKQQAKSKVEETNRRYEAKLDEAAAAAEWMTEDILREADDIEREKEDWQDEWRQLADKQRLVKSVQSFRRRIDANERDLNISAAISETENSEVKSELRDALRDHMRSNQQVDELLQLFTNSRELDRSESHGQTRDLSKHEERMNKRQRNSQERQTNSAREEKRDPSPAMQADD